MSDQADELQERTMQFALDALQLIRLLPPQEPGQTVKRQFTKAATSVAANYRATRRSRSHDEFTARMGIVAEESDESQFWLELMDRGRLVNAPMLQKLQQEATQLSAIFSSSYGTARRNKRTEE